MKVHSLAWDQQPLFPDLFLDAHLLQMTLSTIHVGNGGMQYLPQYQPLPYSAFHWHQLNIKAINHLSPNLTVLPTFDPSNCPCIRPVCAQLPNDNTAGNSIKSLSNTLPPPPNDIRCSSLMLVVISSFKKSIIDRVEISFIISEIICQQIVQL